jgi:hypothetical protein
MRLPPFRQRADHARVDHPPKAPHLTPHLTPHLAPPCQPARSTHPPADCDQSSHFGRRRPRGIDAKIGALAIERFACLERLGHLGQRVGQAVSLGILGTGGRHGQGRPPVGCGGIGGKTAANHIGRCREPHDGTATPPECFSICGPQHGSTSGGKDARKPRQKFGEHSLLCIAKHRLPAITHQRSD